MLTLPSPSTLKKRVNFSAKVNVTLKVKINITYSKGACNIIRANNLTNFPLYLIINKLQSYALKFFSPVQNNQNTLTPLKNNQNFYDAI